MLLDIPRSFNKKVFTPYHAFDREYYLLFRRNGLPGPFTVSDSPFDTSGTLIQIGVMTNPGGVDAGYIFYSRSPTICEGTFVLAYSGTYKEEVNRPRSKVKDFGMEFLFKTGDFYLYNQKNASTLVTGSSIKAVIRRNFEV